MLSRARVLTGGSAVFGAAVGASFGWPLGWVVAQAAMLLQLVALIQAGERPGQAMLRGALFSACLAAVGYAGFAFSLDNGWQSFALFAYAGLVLLHAAAGAALAGFVVKLRLTDVQRWLFLWPALWCLQEWLAAQGELALPWLQLGVMHASGGPFVAAFPLAGTLLATLLMWSSTALLALAHLRPALRRQSLVGVGLMVAVVVGLGTIVWTVPSGLLSLRQIPLDASGGAPSEDLLSSGSDTVSASKLAKLLEVASRSENEVLVTAQLALPKVADSLPPGYLDLLGNRLAAKGSDLLLGTYIEAGGHALGYYNGVLSLGASGPQQYRKHQLFPFGEFLPSSGPLRRWALDLLPSTQIDTVAGEPGQGSISLAGHRAALSVCFELVFGGSWRQAAAEADVLINLSSDQSHRSVQFERQTRQHMQARALEYGKPMLRSTDVGAADAVDAQGQFVQAVHDTIRLQAHRGLTPFARAGEVVPLALALAAIVVVLLLALAGGYKPAAVASARPVARAQQSGQILMAAVGLLLVTAGMLYFMVNAGQTVTEKTRVTNAADAAAYSAGIVEARALNYDAYLNRAMVANEISIAQMVSLASWLRYFALATDNIPGTMGDITFMLQPDLRASQLSVIFAAAKYGVSYLGMTAEELADYVVDYGIGPIIGIHEGVVTALSASQVAVHVNLLAGVRQRQVADDLVKAMDPALRAEVVLPSHGFDSFTKAYSGNERGRFADVTTRSRDPFTRERNWTIDSFDIPLIRKDGALKKRGGTDLVGFDEWRAVDTLELHGRRFGCGKFGLSWCSDIQTPIGWGAVNVNAGTGDTGRGYHGNAYNENRRTAGNADSDMREPQVYLFRGLPTSRELRDFSANAVLSTGITVLVSKSQGDLMTSGGAATAKPSGSLELFSDKPAGGQLIALSRAQVYFDRIAARADGKTESASLFNPYWRVRLVAPTAADRVYAATKQGGLMLPTLP